jgi:glycosyltransferase involved in cell wall biosynthesis
MSSTRSPKTLFICKSSDIPNSHYGYFRKYSGLFNSARFVSEMLIHHGVESDTSAAADNNDIDRLVTKHKPDIVFIEALWVVPEKFDILRQLHPHIKWVIRLHSQLPFLAMEGVAMEWIMKYVTMDNVYVAPNTVELTTALKGLLSISQRNRIVYLPNYYPTTGKLIHDDIEDGQEINRDLKAGDIHIGCFGAIRPFKNQLSQAVAAIMFADTHNLNLKFHINKGRVEAGENNLRNIEALFEASKNHVLVEHEWVPHDKFLKIVASMDLGMQVSYTESFNIVMADMVISNIPVITSPSVHWVHPIFYADPNSVESMADALDRIWYLRRIKAHNLNLMRLKKYSRDSIKAWKNFISTAC